MKIKEFINIETKHIHPHPQNPRKDLGSLEELAESIKKNGVMQNLTVIPMNEQPGEYITVIGHRRCAAAKIAGIAELPCTIIESMSEKEQVSTMLEENMQRNDLTIYEQAKGDKNAKTIRSLLKKIGVEKAPDGTENEIYSGKWKTLKEFELDKDAPKQIKLPKEKEPMYWIICYRILRVIVKASKEKREFSKWEQEQKEHDQAKRKIKAILRESTARRKEFIQNIISGKIDAVKDETKVKDTIWSAMVVVGSSIYESTLRYFFYGKEEYKCTDEEKEEAKNKVVKLDILHQMLILLHASMESTNELYNQKGRFNQRNGASLLKGYEALEAYGWYFESEDEKKVLDGTHELYRDEKDE